MVLFCLFVCFQAIKATMHTSKGFIATLAAIGTAGLFISLPAGMLADRYGTAITTLAGALSICAGYMVMSVAKSSFILCLAYAFVGVGSGSTFLAALQTAISVGNSFGIGLVSLCMSMSITLTVKYVNKVWFGVGFVLLLLMLFSLALPPFSPFRFPGSNRCTTITFVATRLQGLCLTTSTTTAGAGSSGSWSP